MCKIAVAAPLLLLAGCADVCSNMVVESSKSPDGVHAATLFLRDCGATTGFSTQISVLNTGDRLSGGGNAFIADADHGLARLGEWQGPWADMKWLASDRLLIRYAARSRVFEQDAEVSGVDVSYEVIR